MNQKIYKLFLFALLTLSGVGSLNAQNQVYWREGFEPNEGTTLTTTNPTSVTPAPTTDVTYFFNGVGGSWWGKNVYRTTGTGCPTGNNHPRFRNMGVAGTFDSGALVTPVVDFGIQEFHFARARASRTYTIWVTSDTSALTSNWTFVGRMDSWGNPTCVDTTFVVGRANAKRLKLVTRAGLDVDIDSVWLTSVNAIVPVKFGDVNVSRNNGLVKLNWNVLLEVNTEKYYIERSVNGVEFASIGSLSATNTKSYSYVDAAPLNSATSFYRLKAVDKDGKLSYSNIIRLTSRNTAADVIVTPNPIKNGTVNLQLNNFTKSDYSVSLFDASGKIAFTKKMNIESGSSAQTLQLPNTVSKGIYQLQITNGSIKMNKTVVVQ
jgi:hypothetical protein